MEEVKEKYLITKEEEKILNGIDELRNNLNTNIEQSEFQITSIEYYGNFDLIPKEEEFYLKNIFLVEKTNLESGLTIKEIRTENELIATVDENNELIFNPDSTYQSLYAVMDDYLELDSLKEENVEGLLATSQIEDIKYLEEKDKEFLNENRQDGDEEEKKEKEVSNDLGEEIVNIKEIQDEEFYEKIPNMRKNGENMQIGFSRTKNNFVAFSKNKEGKYECMPECAINNNVKKEVLILQKDGKTLKKVRVSAIINTNKKDEFIAVDFGQYGYTDEYMISKDDDSHIVGRQMDVRGKQHIQNNIKEQIDEEDEVHSYGEDGENLDNNEEKQIGLNEVIYKVAEKLGRSPEYVEQVYDNSQGETAEIKIKNTIKIIEEENSKKSKEFNDDEELQRTQGGDAYNRRFNI